MSTEYVALSFFKTNKIDYYYKKPIITFPCPDCGKEAKMNAFEATWSCNACFARGTLVSLIKLTTSSHSGKLTESIYNPGKEILDIRRLLQEVKRSSSERNQKLIEKAYNKTNALYSYLKTEPE
ncbi:hypothetical protein [Paenibacillus sp. NEAU-GSW1]|uniref:hypothetical protein n=1 Tax=Paenibacillus sp. NEAU-GSW1 TaxID=2682486 RepID=UPI0012E19164|nr:hypothetical protein [Paenibacillus sp. NEAU-GSW1]MUT68499.1 hypothetical protein [Paenibacillus sp. NEAU-GSW1]